MVSRSIACFVIAFALATVSLRADSVTTRDGVSLRGRVVALDGRGAVVRARFEDGETQVLVPREAIAGIEFNALSSNAGFSTMGLPSAVPARRRVPSADQLDDVVVLRTGERRPCPRVEIDGQRLRCGAEVVSLGDVTSLTFGRIR
jgi:hypothetical protein